MKKRGLFAALATLLGTTIGAGIFALPYVIAQSGFLIGMGHLFVVGIVMLLVSLYLGEVVLRTKGQHQLVGLAEKYLGKKGRLLMNAAVVFSVYGALIAYTFGAGDVLAVLTGISSRAGMLLFFAVLALVIYCNLEVFENFEEIFTPLKVLVVIVLGVIALFFMKPQNLTMIAWKNFFVPYGIVLFAYTGVSVIPEMHFALRDKKLLKKAIILGMVCSGIIYALFTAAVLGVAGTSLNEVTTISLGEALGKGMGLLLNLFTLLALGTAFVALGFALKDVYVLDFKKTNLRAWMYVVLVPLAFILLGLGGFVQIIEVTGILGIGLILVLILLMHRKAKGMSDRTPEFEVRDAKFLKMLIIALILFGVFYELWRLFV